MDKKNTSKHFLSKIAFLTTIFGATVINEQVLVNRIKKQKEKFDNEKEILNNKISSLEEKVNILEDTSFRFYEHLPNGANFSEFKRINEEKFVRKEGNSYEKYRPDVLTEELLTQTDSVENNENISAHDISEKQLEDWDKFSKSDSINQILENGQTFLNSTLEVMKIQNKALNGNLARILKNSDEENDREFNARYFMFKVKTKNQMYHSSYDLMADYYRTVFLKNVSVYKRTASYISQLIDSLSLDYENNMAKDSIEFEKEKNRKLDSIVSTPVKPKIFKISDFAKETFYINGRNK